MIDTDAGADDALAILLVLLAGKISNYELLGITCTYGNTDEKNVEQNVLKTLTVANFSHVNKFFILKINLSDGKFL